VESEGWKGHEGNCGRGKGSMKRNEKEKICRNCNGRW
jgi:hypothetical protein